MSPLWSKQGFWCNLRIFSIWQIQFYIIATHSGNRWGLLFYLFINLCNSNRGSQTTDINATEVYRNFRKSSHNDALSVLRLKNGISLFVIWTIGFNSKTSGGSNISACNCKFEELTFNWCGIYQNHFYMQSYNLQFHCVTSKSYPKFCGVLTIFTP